MTTQENEFSKWLTNNERSIEKALKGSMDTRIFSSLLSRYNEMEEMFQEFENDEIDFFDIDEGRSGWPENDTILPLFLTNLNVDVNPELYAFMYLEEDKSSGNIISWLNEKYGSVKNYLSYDRVKTGLILFCMEKSVGAAIEVAGDDKLSFGSIETVLTYHLLGGELEDEYIEKIANSPYRQWLRDHKLNKITGSKTKKKKHESSN